MQILKKLQWNFMEKEMECHLDAFLRFLKKKCINAGFVVKSI